MKVNIEQLNSSQTIYMRSRGPYGGADNFKMMNYFKQWIIEHKLQETIAHFGLLGIALDHPQQTAPEDCRYDLVLFVENKIEATDKVNSGYFEGGKYAVFSVPHTKEAVQNFWAEMEKHVNENGLIMRESPIIERFKEPVGEENSCEFLLPIQ